MRRLFQLYDRTTRSYLVNGQRHYFAAKTEAKASRDALRSLTGDEIVVHLGPDHREFGRKPFADNSQEN
jgi:hypothetical protein